MGGAHADDEGFVEGRSAEALRLRRRIAASDVAVFADAQVKHGAHAMTGDRAVAELARDVELLDADVAIATRNRTGDSILEDEITAIRAGTSLPVIGGSGLSIRDVAKLLPLLDGAVVGPSLETAGRRSSPVERGRVEELVTAARNLRTEMAPHRA